MLIIIYLTFAGAEVVNEDKWTSRFRVGVIVNVNVIVATLSATHSVTANRFINFLIGGNDVF